MSGVTLAALTSHSCSLQSPVFIATGAEERTGATASTSSAAATGSVGVA